MIFDEDPDRCSSNIVIESNRINDITCWTKEIPGTCEIILVCRTNYDNQQ